MRVAAIYDIHGNLPALQAVLEDIRRAGVDLVVVGGDVVPGPMPRETIAFLSSLNIATQAIYGNGEVAVLEEMAGRNPSDVPEQYRPIVRWVAQQLGPEHEKLFASWPKTFLLEMPRLGKVLFCHATPGSENEIFTKFTPDERLSSIFNGLDASIVVCGHTHMQFERTVGGVRIVNAGSVGMPFGNAGAYWLLLGSDIQFRHTSYDLTKAAKRIRQTNYLQGEEFAARNILQPPSEEEMLEVFARAELK
jgi:putative phosphoesterase